MCATYKTACSKSAPAPALQVKCIIHWSGTKLGGSERTCLSPKMWISFLGFGQTEFALGNIIGE